MLIVRVYVNDEEIDQIHIQRGEPRSPGAFNYYIRKPAGFNEPIEHRYRDGYIPLLRKALEKMEEK
jgi:hypothetical protein